MNSRTLTKCFLTPLLALLLAVASLAPSVSAQQERLLVTMGGTPGMFNPLYAFRDIEMLRTYLPVLYEPLILTLLNGTLVPWLAKSWEITTEGNYTIYRFHIDERAKWSDGTPFTAHDVAYSWNLGVTLAGGLTPEAILRNVTAVADYTVEFNATQPNVRWQIEYGGYTAFPEHIFSKVEDPMSYSFLSKPEEHVTTGPFKYDSFKEGEWYLFRTRPDYWKTESKPKIDGVLYRVITDPTILVTALLAGELDVINVDINMVPQVEGQPNIGIWAFPHPYATEYLAVNTRLYPLGLKEVRQAIDLAIDKVKIAQECFWGYGTVGDRCLINLEACPEFSIPEARWPGRDMTHAECVAEANRILDRLGFTRGADGIRVTPNGTRLSFLHIFQSFPAGTLRAAAAEEITRNLAEIGIEVTLQAMGFEFFVVAFLAPPFTFGFAQGTYGEYPEPWYCQVYNFLSPAIGLAQIMTTGWNNTEVDKFGDNALRSLTYEELVGNVKEMLKIYAPELPTICVAFYQMSIYAYRTDKLTNWDWNACTKTGAFGYPLAYRPAMVNLLTPVTGPTPTPTPTPKPTPTPTPKPTPTPTGPTPTPAPTPTPTPPPTAAAGLTTEQIIIIAIIIIVVIAAIGYIAVRARKKR